MRFTFLMGDANWQDYGGKFVSRKLNNGEFDYWLVMEVVNWADAVGEREAPAKYNVSLSVVSPSEAGEENVKSAFCCCGLEFEQYKVNTMAVVESLHSYGIHAPIWNADGNNLSKLMRQARKEADIKGSFLFGFAMDAPKNAIGSSGWDFLRGDITAGLYKS